MSSSVYTEEHKARLAQTPARYMKLRDELHMTNEELCTAIKDLLPKVGGPLKDIKPLSLARKILKLGTVGISPSALDQLLRCLDQIAKSSPSSATGSLDPGLRTSGSGASALGNGVRSKVRLIVPELPETILPHLFRFVYDVHLPIQITTEKHWGNFGERLEKDKTAVFIHSFSTVLAHNQTNPHNQLLFFPLLAFKGYDVVVTKAYLDSFRDTTKGLRPGQGMESWGNAHRKDFFGGAKILCERHTDFEWYISKVCLEFGCSLEDMVKRKQIEDTLTQDALSTFLRNKSKAVILPTNAMTVAALRYQKTEVAEQLVHQVQHSNYDGFICTKVFFDSHKDEMRDLIWCWFETRKVLIALLKEEWKEDASLGSLHQKSLLSILQRLANGIALSVPDLRKIYGKEHCTYFPSYPDAVEAFKRDVLYPSELQNNHEEIAQMLMNGSELSKDWVQVFQEELDKATATVKTNKGSNG